MAEARDRMVTAIFRDPTQAQHAFDWLVGMGHSATDVNVMMSEQTRTRHFLNHPSGRTKETVGSHAVEGSAVGGAVGTGVGAAAGAVAAATGAIAGLSTFVLIPGIGWVAGPIIAALAGAGVGGVAGGIVGGLIGLGIPESNVKAYEKALRDGGVAIGVVPHSDEDSTRIKKFFENNGGENVIVVGA